ncbi:MAG: hypothetical protein QM619_16970 [Micropruina sp.]|uniref:alpha/beta fold hydrolase n=1 Tax=Micropruina sp. TaxID=2737536 RepID=UPI0039E38FBD
MAVQSAVPRALHGRLVAGDGIDKATLLRLLSAAAGTDVRGRLGEIALPTVVLCGSRDRANLPAACQLAQGVRGSRLRNRAGRRAHLERHPSATVRAIVGEFAADALTVSAARPTVVAREITSELKGVPARYAWPCPRSDVISRGVRTPHTAGAAGPSALESWSDPHP